MLISLCIFNVVELSEISVFKVSRIQNFKNQIISMSKKYRIDEHRDNGVDSLNDCQAQPTMQFLSDHAPRGEAHRCKPRNVELSTIVFRYKVFKHVNNFVRKLRMNSTLREPVKNQSLLLESEQNPLGASWLLNKLSCGEEQDGICIGNAGMIAWAMVNIIQVTMMVFIYSVIITFPEVQESSLWLYFRIFSISLYLVDMVMNFSVKRYDQGRYLQKIGEISAYYLRSDFMVDLVTILIFPIDIIVTVGTNLELIIFGTALVKLVSSIRKFNKFEYMMFSSSAREHYLGLLKILLINFAIGHFLSICLNKMARIDLHQNWHYKVGIQYSSWAVKYIWGYYWGTNIMLTVGFGDLCATNHIEALILIFVETFSCITLAYNISSVGTLIGSIRENEKIKKRKLQIFHQMCKQNSTPNQLQSKITNFIEEKYKAKESFEYGTQDEIMEVLPEILSKEFINTANQNLFESLRFFKDLPKKGLKQLAAHIKRKVCHPEQIVLKKGKIADFVVLRHGCLSLICEVQSKLNGKEVQIIEVKQGNKPIIIAADFSKSYPLKYSVKSRSFSVVFSLSQVDIMNCLKGSKLSYQMLCMLRDRHDYVEHGVLQCTICQNQNHTKFECNRLHYVPLHGHIVMKHIHHEKVAKQPRQLLFNCVKFISSSLLQRGHVAAAFQKLSSFNQQLMNFCLPKLIQNYETADYRVNSMAFDTQLSSTFESNIGNMEGPHRKKQTCNFWELEADCGKNFKFYFAENNPSVLSSNRFV